MHHTAIMLNSPIVCEVLALDSWNYRWVPLKPDFWEHENLSSLSVIQLIYIKLYKEKEKNMAKNPG